MVSFLTRLFQRAPKDQWLVYSVDTEGEAKFFLEALQRLEHSHTLQRKDDMREVLEASKAPFIYVGYGDSKGVFRTRGYDFGYKEWFCSIESLGDFPHHPSIWFANRTAEWLKADPEGKWFGFSNPIGIQFRSKAERSWWAKALYRMWSAILLAGLGHRPRSHIKAEMRSLCKEILRRYQSNGSKYSYFSVIAMQNFAKSATFGDAFGTD